MAKTLYIPDEEEYTTAHTPLLRSFPRDPEDALEEPTPRTQRSTYHVLGLVLTIVFAADLAGSISKAPLIRVYESIICNSYYKTADPGLIKNGQVEEWYCKVAPVQEELALLRGWHDFFDYLPGLFLAIPFGMLADKFGRKWLSVLNVTSMWARAIWIYVVCAFPHVLPLRLIWLQGALGVFGGGSLVASALLFVITTDVTPKPQRTNVFLYAHAALCATEFFGPPIGSILMDHSPWIPLALSIALLTINIPLSLALPETLPKPPRSPKHPSIVLTPSKPPFLPPSPLQTLKSHLSPLAFLLRDPRILFLLTTSIAYIVAQASNSLTMQYTSRRYAWTLSHTAYLTSIRAILMLTTLLLILPLASTHLLRLPSFPPLRKDLLLLRLSFSAVAAGLLLEGLAPGIPLFVFGCAIATMGMGATALIRSVLASWVRPAEVGRLFAVMSLVWTAAMLVASPGVAMLFAEGLKRGGVWMGLPFLGAGVLFVVASGAMWGVGLGGEGAGAGDEEEEEEEEERSWGDEGGGHEGLGEKENYLRPPPPPPTSSALGVKVEGGGGDGVKQLGVGRHVPAPLMLDGSREVRAMRRPSYLEMETPLYSPGLRIMETRGGL